MQVSQEPSHVPTEFVFLMETSWGRGATPATAFAEAITRATSRGIGHCYRVPVGKWDLEDQGLSVGISWEDAPTREPLGKVDVDPTDLVCQAIDRGLTAAFRGLDFLANRDYPEIIRQRLEEVQLQLEDLSVTVDDIFGDIDEL